MNRLSEPQLREYDAAKAITSLKIVRFGAGYVVVVQVQWKKADLVLFNQRNRPRVWKNLDRLVAHLTNATPSLRRAELVFRDEL